MRRDSYRINWTEKSWKSENNSEASLQMKSFSLTRRAVTDPRVTASKAQAAVSYLLLQPLHRPAPVVGVLLEVVLGSRAPGGCTSQMVPCKYTWFIYTTF